MVVPEITACSQTSSFLPSAITEDMFDLEMPDELPSGILTSDNVSITMDNSLSPAHTLVQIVCQDHKGLLYDIMRTLKDYNIQVNNKCWTFYMFEFVKLNICRSILGLYYHSQFCNINT
jgi:hypothetical protein